MLLALQRGQGAPLPRRAVLWQGRICVARLHTRAPVRTGSVRVRVRTWVAGRVRERWVRGGEQWPLLPLVLLLLLVVTAV